MNVREITITRLIKSRPFALLLMIVAAAAAFAFAFTTGNAYQLLSPDMELLQLPQLSNSATIGLCMALNAGVVIVMSLVNGQFNLLRTTSWLFLSMWMMSQLGTPGIMTHASIGLWATLGILACIWISVSIYQQPAQTKRVFLLFFIITCLGCFNYAYWAYLPVFLAGMAQMRAVSLRSLLAAGVGIVVPAWLLWAFAVVDFADVTLPRFDFTSLAMLKANPVAAIATVFTLVTGLIMMSANMVKVYGYNALTRAHNGLLLLVWLVTALLCVFDFGNLWATLPLLNCTTAFQTGMFFRIYARQRAYLPVILMITVYTTLYVLTIWI